MPQLPTGSITLLFTDIEGSTRLLQQLGNRYAAVLRDCRRLLRAAFHQGNGFEVDTQGDSFFVVFERAVDGVLAAVNAQRALFAAHWPEGAVVRVRMGVHTGEPQPADEGYIGLDVHCAARIMSVAHGGQVLLSRTTCDLVTADLPEGLQLRDLGEYRLKDIAGPHQLFQLVIPDVSVDFPPVSAARSGRPLRVIPSPATSFVGREAEVAAISNLLRRSDVRILTLIGTAGVGKTRLALRVAAQLSSMFNDGLCFVALDQVSGVDTIYPALAQALNIQEEKERSLPEQVKMALRDQSLLLILDNFERILSASLEVADLLTACPGLKVLVTSRIMLHIQAEHLFEVSPLPLLDPGRLPDHAELLHSASIALFVQRAQAVQPDFQLTAANASTVASVCTRLDGIPLAIELAAARVRHFSPQVLLAQLERGLAILQGEARDVPARQQTLRAAIAWSYDLLEPGEQHVFRRFAICVNGATPEAAGRICAVGDEDTAALLEALVDKSMLLRQRWEKQQGRYGQLQTLREYGLEQLTRSGELEATRAIHASYYLAWAEQVAPQLLGAEQVDWLDRMDREYENVKSALEWLLEGSGLEMEWKEQALRFCIALLGFWEIRGYIGEGLLFLERALVERHNTPSSIQAQALHGTAFLALMQNEYMRAEELLRECQSLFRESGDRSSMANILQLQGNLALVTNSYKLARRLLDEALALYREEGDATRIASTREALAQIAIAQCDYSTARSLLEKNIASFRVRGEQYRVAYPLYLLAHMLFLSQLDPDEARTLAQESLALFQAVGNKRLMAYVSSLLGQIVLIGEREKSSAMVEESVVTLKSIGDRSGTAEALIALARIRAFSGENEAAQHCYEESWRLLRFPGAMETGAACLEGYGEVQVALGMPGVAAKLWGVAATVRATIIIPMPPVFRASYRRAVALARKRLGEKAFQEAWAEGHSLPFEQVTIA